MSEFSQDPLQRARLEVEQDWQNTVNQSWESVFEQGDQYCRLDEELEDLSLGLEERETLQELKRRDVTNLLNKTVVLLKRAFFKESSFFQEERLAIFPSEDNWPEDAQEKIQHIIFNIPHIFCNIFEYNPTISLLYLTSNHEFRNVAIACLSRECRIFLSIFAQTAIPEGLLSPKNSINMDEMYGLTLFKSFSPTSRKILKPSLNMLAIVSARILREAGLLSEEEGLLREEIESFRELETRLLALEVEENRLSGLGVRRKEQRMETLTGVQEERNLTENEEEELLVLTRELERVIALREEHNILRLRIIEIGNMVLKRISFLHLLFDPVLFKRNVGEFGRYSFSFKRIVSALNSIGFSERITNRYFPDEFYEKIPPSQESTQQMALLGKAVEINSDYYLESFLLLEEKLKRLGSGGNLEEILVTFKEILEEDRYNKKNLWLYYDNLQREMDDPIMESFTEIQKLFFQKIIISVFLRIRNDLPTFNFLMITLNEFADEADERGDLEMAALLYRKNIELFHSFSRTTQNYHFLVYAAFPFFLHMPLKKPFEWLIRNLEEKLREVQSSDEENHTMESLRELYIIKHSLYKIIGERSLEDRIRIHQERNESFRTMSERDQKTFLFQQQMRVVVKFLERLIQVEKERGNFLEASDLYMSIAEDFREFGDFISAALYIDEAKRCIMAIHGETEEIA